MLLKRILGFGVTTVGLPLPSGMKILSAILLVLVILSVSSAAHVNEAVSAWIPEHRCVKRSYSSKCDSYKCVESCSTRPQGHGKCRGRYCICTYYCRQPPL